jgi:hypothetical protein
MTTAKHYKGKREIYCLLTSVKEEKKETWLCQQRRGHFHFNKLIKSFESKNFEKNYDFQNFKTKMSFIEICYAIILAGIKGTPRFYV